MLRQAQQAPRGPPLGLVPTMPLLLELRATHTGQPQAHPVDLSRPLLADPNRHCAPGESSISASDADQHEIDSTCIVPLCRPAVQGRRRM